MQLLKELKKNKITYISFYVLILMGFMAVFAPFLANNKPFVIYTKNQIVYKDYLDGARSTLGLILKDLKSGKKTYNDENISWTKKCIKEVASFIEDESKSAKLLNYGFLKVLKNKNIERLEELSKYLDSLESVNLNKRLFFPLFKSLTFQNMFFPFLFILSLFCFVFRKRLFLKKLKILEKILIILLVSSAFSLLFSSLKKEQFLPYNYKLIASNFSSGEWALFPIVYYGENENIITESKQAPTLLLSKANYKENQQFHLLGTDTNGRDVLARMLYGSQISMSIGFVAVGIYVLIGIIIGAIAGFYGGKTDMIISRLMEIVICFPVFFLILTVMAFLKPSIFNIMVIIGLTGWPSVARLMRGEFLRLREREFVKAARAMGSSDFRIIFSHILPNGLAPIIISATFGVAGAILTESALSFLGFGVPQPTASWGDLLNNGRGDIYGSWWLTVFPGIAIFLTVTAFNLLGEFLRDFLDPKRRNAI